MSKTELKKEPNEDKIEIPNENKNINEITDLNDKVKNKKIFIFLVIFGILLFFVLLFGGIACVNKLNANVYKNVYILNQDISGYSYADLKSFIEEKNNSQMKGNIEVFQDTDQIFEIVQSDIDLKVDLDKTISDVLNFGRTGSIFKDNYDILHSLFFKKNIEVSYTYNSEKLNEIINNINLSIKNGVVESKYSIDEENKKLVITIGKSGNGINFDNEKEKVLNLTELNFCNNQSDSKLYLNIIKISPKSLNVDEIYSNVKREAMDAYIDKNSYNVKLVSEVVGYDLDINKLRKVLENDENLIEGNEIEFELTVIEPKVKLENLESELYKDKLAGYTTYFNASQYARANNLEIALRYLNGKVVMPGETFSYNDAIGDTTAAKGYLPAATFKGGTTVDEMGGGICQTTSTLYNVVLMANLEIVERHQHGLPVGYVQPSRDATVYSPYLDFKFKNTRSSPIKIVTSFSSSGNLNISIYGIKEEKEYQIDIISQYLTTIPFTTKYIYDENLPEGTQQIISNGVNGYTSQSFISKKLDGVQVSYELLSKDTYNAQQQVVKVGTRKD